MKKNIDKNQVKTQSTGIIVLFVLQAILKSVIGYIALYFFKPIWDKITLWWKNRKTKVL